MKASTIAAAAALGLLAPVAAHAETACEDLAKTALPHAEVTKATTETFNGKQFARVGVPVTIAGYALMLLFAVTYWRWLGYV